MNQADLVALQRSTAMIAPGAPAAIKREELLEILDEITATRALLARLGADLKTVARRARPSAQPSD
ncbi:MAG: hypothetical protein ABJD24_04460 [Acidimicrobiales bacterium]